MGWLEEFVLGEAEVKRKRQKERENHYEKLREKEERLLRETGHGLLYKGSNYKQRVVPISIYRRLRTELCAKSQVYAQILNEFSKEAKSYG